MLFQSTVYTPKAEASSIVDTYVAVSAGIAFEVGMRACSYPCAAAATAAVVIVNNNAAAVAEKTVEYVKPGLLQMFTNWAATYVLP